MSHKSWNSFKIHTDMFYRACKKNNEEIHQDSFGGEEYD